MPENLTTTDETLLLRQRACLLHQLASAPNGTLLQSAANSTIPKQIKDELALKSGKQINDLRWKMVVAGWLTEQKLNKAMAHTITETGRQELRRLESYLPLLPARGTVNPPTDERTRLARRVYVLTALESAPQHTISKAELEMGFGGKDQPKTAELVKTYPHLAMFRDQSCLKLNPATTRAVCSDLALSGEIQVHRTDGTESYSLTPSGSARLKQLRAECPALPPTGKPAPAPNELVRRGREAFVLLKQLQCAKYTLWASDAAVGSYPKPLKLNHATAWEVRDELSQQGYIDVHWDGQEASYILTPAGKKHLTTLPFEALGEVKIQGSALTELLTTASENTTHTKGAASTTPQATLSPQQFEKAVLDIFDELLRGPFANLRMVPIHELRSEVTKRLGSPLSSHTDFNELLLGLRRVNRVRLISIDDRSQATADQLRNSIFAFGETLFFMERVHASA